MAKKEQQTKLMLTSPEMARNWLLANTQNRHMRRTFIERLIRDIKNGFWRVTHQGIAFDTNGALRDGQHRLTAIAEAGIPVWINVTNNVEPDSMIAVDQGMTRASHDQATIFGGIGIVTAGQIATLRKMITGLSASFKMSNSEEVEKMKLHREAILWCDEHTKTARLSAGFRAAIARSYYSADRERVESFCQAITVGMVTQPDQHAAVILSRFLQDRTTKIGGSAMQRIVYAKTCRALWAYLHGEKIESLYGATKELFPLPEEIASNKSK